MVPQAHSMDPQHSSRLPCFADHGCKQKLAGVNFEPTHSLGSGLSSSLLLFRSLLRRRKPPRWHFVSRLRHLLLLQSKDFSFPWRHPWLSDRAPLLSSLPCPSPFCCPTPTRTASTWPTNSSPSTAGRTTRRKIFSSLRRFAAAAKRHRWKFAGPSVRRTWPSGEA